MTLWFDVTTWCYYYPPLWVWCYTVWQQLQQKRKNRCRGRYKSNAFLTWPNGIELYIIPLADGRCSRTQSTFHLRAFQQWLCRYRLRKLSFPTLQNTIQRRIIFKLVVPLKLLAQNGHKRSNPEIDVTVNNDLSISLQPFQSLLSTVGGCYRLHIQENTNQYAIVNPSQWRSGYLDEPKQLQDYNDSNDYKGIIREERQRDKRDITTFQGLQ